MGSGTKPRPPNGLLSHLNTRLAAGASCRTPLGELAALLQTLSCWGGGSLPPPQEPHPRSRPFGPRTCPPNPEGRSTPLLLVLCFAVSLTFFLHYGVKAAGECSVFQNPKLSSHVCVTTGMCLLLPHGTPCDDKKTRLCEMFVLF